MSNFEEYKSKLSKEELKDIIYKRTNSIDVTLKIIQKELVKLQLLIKNI